MNAAQYMPTPDEIHDMCREIQSTWSEWTRENRRVLKTQRPVEVIGVNRASLTAIPSAWYRNDEPSE